MISIKQEVQDEILAFIKAKTGAAAVDVICLTSEIPCKEEREGKGCLAEHYSDEFGYGIAPNYMQSFHMQAAGVDVFGTPMEEGE